MPPHITEDEGQCFQFKSHLNVNKFVFVRLRINSIYCNNSGPARSISKAESLSVHRYLNWPWRCELLSTGKWEQIKVARKSVRSWKTKETFCWWYDGKFDDTSLAHLNFNPIPNIHFRFYTLHRLTYNRVRTYNRPLKQCV